MSVLIYLIPVSLLLGIGALVLFLWSMRSGQYEDLDGAAERILYDEDVPLPPAKPVSDGARKRGSASKADPEAGRASGHHARSP